MLLWRERKEPMDKFKFDVQSIEEAMKDYSGAEGAHFGFIYKDAKKRQHMFGGNAALIGAGLTEGIVELIKRTPGLDTSFVDTIHEVVHMVLDGDDEAEGTVQ